MNSCHGIRDDLVTCLLETDCVQRQGRTAQDCLQNEMPNLPMHCQQIYRSFVQCRRGLLDMRKRFRGNAPPVAKSNDPPGGTTKVATAVEPQQQQQ